MCKNPTPVFLKQDRLETQVEFMKALDTFERHSQMTGLFQRMEDMMEQYVAGALSMDTVVSPSAEFVKLVVSQVDTAMKTLKAVHKDVIIKDIKNEKPSWIDPEICKFANYSPIIIDLDLAS